MTYKRWIFVAIILFGIGLILGMVTPTNIASFIFEDIDTALEEISGIVVPFSILTLIFIFAEGLYIDRICIMAMCHSMLIS